MSIVYESFAQECDSSIPTVEILADTDSVDNDCLGTPEGLSCMAWCKPGYAASEAGSVAFTCAGDTFVIAEEGGDLLCAAIPCSGASQPVGPGVMHDCQGKATGQTCEAFCRIDTEGAAQTFTCLASGNFAGTAPKCKGPCDDSAATVALLMDPMVDASPCMATKAGGECEAVCQAGYGPPTPDGTLSTRFTCSNGTFAKVDDEDNWDLQCTTPEVCVESPDASDETVDGSACAGLAFGESCEVACALGYTGEAASATCGARGDFIYDSGAPLCTMDDADVAADGVPCGASEYPDAKAWFDAIADYVDVLSDIDGEDDKKDMLIYDMLPSLNATICEHKAALEMISPSSECDMVTTEALGMLRVDSSCLCGGACEEMWDMLTEVKDDADANPTAAECSVARCYLTQACDPTGTSMEARMEDFTRMLESACDGTRSAELGEGELSASFVGGAEVSRKPLAPIIAAICVGLAAFASS